MVSPGFGLSANRTARLGCVSLARVEQFGRRPTGWVAQQSRYGAIQKVLVPALGACVRVELSGTLMYERSTAAEGATGTSDTWWSPTRRWKRCTNASCAHGADLIFLSHVHLAQAWATSDGRALHRRATTWGATFRGVIVHNTGSQIDAHGVTAKGKICLTVTPSLIGRVDQGDTQVEATAPLHPVTVCGPLTVTSVTGGSSAIGKTGARTRAEAAPVAEQNGWL